jgi:hypothetical protein
MEKSLRGKRLDALFSNVFEGEAALFPLDSCHFDTPRDYRKNSVTEER